MTCLTCSYTRPAQQLLVDEGFLRTEQGRGAFVVRSGQPSMVDPLAALEQAAAELARARASLEASRAERFDLDLSDEDVRQVVTEALREWLDRSEARPVANAAHEHVARRLLNEITTAIS